MEIAQLHREKQINQVIENGESMALMDIRKAKTDIAVYYNKLGEIETALNRNEDVMQEFKNKQSKLEKEFNCLKDEAKKIGVKLSKPKKRPNDNAKRYKKLEEKMSVVKKELTLLRTRYNLTAAEFANERNELHKKMSLVTTKIQQKNEYYFINILVHGLTISINSAP